MRIAPFFLVAFLLLAGCAGSPPSPGSEGSADPAPDAHEYETTWLGADVSWVDDPLAEGRGIWTGTMLTFAPNEAEANRTLLYNVTLRVGSASMRFLKDDVEVGSTILAMGRETRVELPAADKARYSYEFFAESVGAGSIHVGVANRGSVRPSDDAGPVRDRGVGWLLVPLG